MKVGKTEIPIGTVILLLIGFVALVYILKNIRGIKKKPAPRSTHITAAPACNTVKIYPDASPPNECTNTVEGGLEQGGDRKEPRLEGCGFNFLNQEVTAYINYHGINDTFSVKLRGPRHSGDGPCVCNNIHYFNLGSESKAAFGKQAEHTAEYCEFGETAPTLPENQLVGVKCIEWNEGSGVHFQSWTDTGSGWQLVADAVDNGNAGTCSGPASPPFTTSPCVDPSCPEVSTDFRIDGISGGGDVEFSNLSVREIAVPATALTAAPEACTGATSEPTTPAPAAEEEEEPEEEEPEEEEPEETEEEPAEEDEEPPASTGPGTRSQDPTTRRINQCAGLTGETYRACVNARMARALRSRYFNNNIPRIKVGNVI